MYARKYARQSSTHLQYVVIIKLFWITKINPASLDVFLLVLRIIIINLMDICM